MEETKHEIGLPENAFRELKKNESYDPIMKSNQNYREVTVWSVFWGILMAIISPPPRQCCRDTI